MIRLATKQDEPQIQHVVHTVYDEYGFGWEPDGYVRDLYDIENYFAAPNAFWVAELHGQIVGCIGIELFPTISGEPGTIVDGKKKKRIAGTDCELVRLYTLPETRGKQVGLQLCQTCIEYAKSQGRTLMEIWSDVELKRAHVFYEKLGAKNIGERYCPPPDDWTEYGFIYNLR